MNGLPLLLTYTFIGSIAGLIGGVAFLVKPTWSKWLCSVATPFAAGVLLTVAFLDLLPESAEATGDKAFLIVLITILTAFFFEQFLAELHHHETSPRGHHKSTLSIVLIGDTLHNIVDGVAIASAFLIEPSFGLVIAFSTFLHETPHEIADFSILITGGFSRTKALIANFASASTTFIGSLAVYFFAFQSEDAIGSLLAISAGLFIYLGTSDFLPSLRGASKNKWRNFIILILGAGLMFLVTNFTPGHS